MKNSEFKISKKANTLTETIADREISIENHRKINKELMKKLNELETKIKIQEEKEREEGEDNIELIEKSMNSN